MRFNYYLFKLNSFSNSDIKRFSILDNDVGYIETSNNVPLNFFVKCFNKQQAIRYFRPGFAFDVPAG